MKIISLASGTSCWRGLDYFKKSKVNKIKKINNSEYTSIVNGTEKYNVHLDIKHPRKSTCDCPLANGKRIICKHIVVTYFSVFPESVINFEEEQQRLQEEYEEYQDELYSKVIKYINKMSKSELIEELIYVLESGPEWMYDNFVRRNDIE